MKKLISILFVFVCVQLNAQNVFTKDGLDLGPKAAIVEQCIQGGNGAMIDMNGIQIDFEKYCNCAIGELMPTLTSTEIMAHLEEGDLVEFFTTGDNLLIIQACVLPNMEIEDSYTFNDDSKYSELQKSTAIEMCTTLMFEDEETKNMYTESQAAVYCNCAVEGMYSMGITFGEIQSLDDESQVLFNELILPCATLALEGDDSDEFDESYIEGLNTTEEVPIVNAAGNGFNVKIGFGDVERYFMIDSGASEVIINSKLEKKLLDVGEISAGDYYGFSEYTLADGSIINCQNLIIRELKIGNFTVHNVEAAIMPQGSLLLGQSLLKKFTSWKIVSEKEVLILEN
ncbi:MAG: clan AA aspartic protease (TIGR02281 family) [Crocinitomicaceae bacterium]|jgi:clan AA aspartic protease (TIGR02281 family)